MSLTNLHDLLKEFLELDDDSIQQLIDTLQKSWSPLIHQYLDDQKAEDLLSTMLGTPNWTRKGAENAP